MDRTRFFVVMAVLLGCTDGTEISPSSGDVLNERPSVVSADPSEVTDSAAGRDDDERHATVICADQRPIETTQVGSVNTIVVPPNAGDFRGDVEALPGAACPGDRVSFDVSVTNTSDVAQVFPTGRGLVFYSGGMANWSVASLSEIGVLIEPGAKVETTVTGTIPPVAPGTYRVGPEGAGFAGEIVVLDPTVD